MADIPNFTPKDWRDFPSRDTPISAAALEDQETRVSTYARSVGEAVEDTLETALLTVASSAALTDGLASKASVADNVAAVGTALRSQGKQNVVDLIDAPPMTKPPTLAFSATGGGSIANLIANGYTGLGSDAVYVPWYDRRIKCLGGGKYDGFNIGYNDSAGRNQFTCHSYPSTSDAKGFRGGALAYYAFDVVGSDFEFIVHDTGTQFYRVWVDGQPHAAKRVPITPGAGTPAKTGPIWLLKVSNLPRGRDRYTIMFEADSALFGGVLRRKADSVLEPTGLGSGPAMVVCGDSYSVAQGLEAHHAWPMKLARLFGIDRIYMSGTGGTGINADNSNNGGNTGYKYQDRLVARDADIPWADVVLVVNQGSTNDGAYSSATAPLRAALKAACLSLWDYEASKAPKALIVQTSTMRCMNPQASDSTANTVYRSAVAERPNVLFIDQETEGWFAGTGFDDTASPSQFLIQSDNSHPTPAGQNEIPRRVAAHISSALSVPSRASVRRRNGGDGLPGILTPPFNTGAASTPLLTAGRAYYNRFKTDDRMVVTKIGFMLGSSATSDDSVMVGIFDRLGVNIAFASATGKLNPSTAGGALVQTVPLSVELDPNTVYYVGLLCPTVGGTAGGIVSFQPGQSAWWQMFGTALPNVLAAHEAGVSTFSGKTIVPSSLTAQYPFLLVRTD